MYEKPPSIEQGPEKHPSEEEVRSLFEQFTAGLNFTETTKNFDEVGLKDWDILVTQDDGSTTHYVYGRKGEYGEHNRKWTQIQVAHFDKDGVPEGGGLLAEVRDGKWVETV